MRTKKWDAFIYGDVNVDIVIPGIEHFPLPGQEQITDIMDTYVGGGAAIFTLGLGKLGLFPVFQGSIGDDCYGSFIKTEFQKNHVDSALLSTSATNKTGISLSFTNKEDRSFLTYRGTNDEINIRAVETEHIKASRHIHLTQYGGSRNHDLYYDLLKQIKEMKDVTISLDTGWDETGEWFEGIYELFPCLDVLFMNETEAIHFSKKENAIEAATDFAKHCRLVVIKLGSKGSIAIADGQLYSAPPYTVDVVDTTGAGDSFNAGFIYGYLKGHEIAACLKYGNACGALSATAYGGNTAFPTEKRLLEFIREQEER